jgi:hypothetical protein
VIKANEEENYQLLEVPETMSFVVSSKNKIKNTLYFKDNINQIVSFRLLLLLSN